MDRECTRLAAKGLGYKLAREMLKPCEMCESGRLKQINVTKSSDQVPDKDNCDSIFLYISTIKIPKDIKVSVTKSHWRNMVDERTGLKLSDFLQEKNVIIEPTCVQFRKLRQGGQPLSSVRCKNAGDNSKLGQVANEKDWNMDINFEYTGAGNPQRNHLA